MNKDLIKELELLRFYKEKGCLDTHYKVLIDYIDELEQENKELHNKIDKAIEYMNGEEFFLLMNSIQTPDKAVCEDYFKAKGNLLEILKDSDVDDNR